MMQDSLTKAELVALLAPGLRGAGEKAGERGAAAHHRQTRRRRAEARWSDVGGAAGSKNSRGRKCADELWQAE